MKLKALFIVPVLFVLVGGMSMMNMGCQTTKGAGRDIEKLGDKIEDTADRND